MTKVISEHLIGVASADPHYCTSLTYKTERPTAIELPIPPFHRGIHKMHAKPLATVLLTGFRLHHAHHTGMQLVAGSFKWYAAQQMSLLVVLILGEFKPISNPSVARHSPGRFPADLDQAAV